MRTSLMFSERSLATKAVESMSVQRDMVHKIWETYLLSHSLHLYGRFPVCILRWRARLEDCKRISLITGYNRGYPYIRKRLLAAIEITLVWLLAGVRPQMHRQSTTLDECFVAPRPTTRIRPLICVNAIMPCKVGLPVEHLIYLLVIHTLPCKQTHRE